MQIAFSYFQRTYSFEKSSFQCTVKCHDFTGSLHLGTNLAVCQSELFKWPSWEFAYYIVDRWFKAGLGISGYCICDFIQGHSQSHLGRYLGNRIAGSLGCQCRRTAYTRIYFNDIVLIGTGVQRVLYVTSTFNAQIADNVDRRGTKHLELSIGQCLSRCHYDGIAGMNAYWVDISMLQTMMQLSALSRITSYSTSFQPATLRSTRIWLIGDSFNPRLAISSIS